MVRTCQRCRRVNPSQAEYCYHDGAVLDGSAVGAVDVGRRPFSIAFHMPNGRACQHFNHLALALHNDPVAALDLLRKGFLEPFLSGQGRADLAASARTAARAADPIRALDDLLGQLPATVLAPARLRVDTPVLDLGKMRIGENRRCEIVLHNEGMRLLHGSAACEAPWIGLGETAALQQKLFQFSDRTVLEVHIRGRQLNAFPKPLEAIIQLTTNGGSVAVPVRVQVDAQPFPEGVLAGATTPRELVDKIRAAQRESPPLLENGAVARWYKANGWSYPVKGQTATGSAALQQFFEALGLSRPPRIEPSEDAIVLTGLPGTTIDYVLAVVTQENRAVIAFGASDQTWLQVGATVFRGRSAMLPLRVAAVPGRLGDTLRAKLSITGNGSQKFVVPVTLVVANQAPPTAPMEPQTPGSGRRTSPEPGPGAVRPAVPEKPSPSPVPTPQVPTPVVLPRSPTTARPTRSNRVLLLAPALLLAATVAGAVWRDSLVQPKTKDEPEVLDMAPRIAILFHDDDNKRDDELERVYMPERQPTMRFGLVMLSSGKDNTRSVNPRRLTFDPLGRTNNTCLRFEKKDERLFGGSRGRWRETKAQTWTDEKGTKHEGARSVWLWDDNKIQVTQFVELVRGEQSRLLDTCRARYRIKNEDNKPHEVGIRFLLDSYIGGNDGVPFTVPGDSALCDTMKDLPGLAKDKKVPDFLQALEKPDLAQPGTIAHLRLKLDKMEPPQRVTLGAWPNEKLRILLSRPPAPQANGLATLWEVPLLSMKARGLNDSAIAIYWKEQPLAAGAEREVGFEYGMWTIASQNQQLGATVDGAFRPDGELTVVAYARQTGDKEESLTLTLPPGFTLIEGSESQVVPKLPADVKSGNRPVTWRVKSGAIGKYEFTVKSSAGLEQTLPVEIRAAIFD